MSTWQYLMLVRNFQYLDEFTVETLIGGRVYFVINWYFNGQYSQPQWGTQFEGVSKQGRLKRAWLTAAISIIYVVV